MVLRGDRNVLQNSSMLIDLPKAFDTFRSQNSTTLKEILRFVQ